MFDLQVYNLFILTSKGNLFLYRGGDGEGWETKGVLKRFCKSFLEKYPTVALALIDKDEVNLGYMYGSQSPNKDKTFGRLEAYTPEWTGEL